MGSRYREPIGGGANRNLGRVSRMVMVGPEAVAAAQGEFYDRQLVARGFAVVELDSWPPPFAVVES